MSTILKTLELPAAIKGDTWEGITLTVDIDGTPVDLTGANIVIEMKSSQGGTFSFSTSGGYPINITDDAGGEFEIASIQSFNEAFGSYNGVLKITERNGDIMSYCIVELQIVTR